MAQEFLNYGLSANDGTGDGLRDTFIKIENNISELYRQAGHASYSDSVYVDSGTAFTLTPLTDTVIPINGGTIYDSEKPSDINEFYYSGGLNVSSIVGTFQVDEVLTGGTSGTTATLREIDVSSFYFLGNSGDFTVSETITGSISGATATVDSLISGFITGRNNDNLDFMLYFKCLPTNNSQYLDIWIDIGGGVGQLYRQTFSFPRGTGVERGILYSLPSAYTRGTWEANGGKIYLYSSHSLDIYAINGNFDTSYRARNNV